MATTSKPTGLTLSRNGNNFTLSWKKGDNNYDAGQNFEWRTNNDAKFIANSIAKRDTSKVKQLSESDYYPNTELLLEWIEMRVRGKRAKYKKKGKTIKPTMSAWATKRLDLAPPKKPQLTATMHESQWNVCTFAWEVETSDTDIYWFNDVEWETILVKESDVTNGADLAWETDETYQSGTGTKTDNQVITEDSFDISDGSYTRWFRVRSRGPAGASGWEYQNHVYGLSYQAIIESAVATVQPAGGFQCRVVWEASANPSHPIDKTTVEYSITVPDANLSCPDDASWTSANVSADTENKDAAVFPIDRLLANDQCLFVRVNTEHDGVNTYGVPRLVDGGVGALSNPTLNSVTIGDNYMVTINATNASSVADSYLVILYRPASDPTREIVLGTIPHGQTSKSVQAPDWSGETAYAFGVYAAVGDSTTISHDGALMKSAIVWGTGNVPKAPENVKVSATNISGTIRVEWDWTWTEADGAELSWADHEDAWESTDEPETYELSNIRNSRWNISGLETGVKWYVKVRLKKGTGENETYGPYSEIQVIDLTSAPSIPTLVLSEPVITETGSVTASWVYTTTDGTAQTYAEICEATITQSGVTYGRSIAHTKTAQHITINANDPDINWQTGETYYLCVRVVSASGRVSDDWSAPVPIAIAEPLDVNITETSLVEETIETNPRTFSGNPISFDTETAEDFTKLEVDIEATQSGSGTPSPSNVRPIRGHSGVNAYVSPTQSADDGTKYSQEFDVSLTPTSTDKVPYTFKAVGRDVYGDRESDKIVGGTVAWNQLVPDENRNFTSTTSDTRPFTLHLRMFARPYTTAFVSNLGLGKGVYTRLFVGIDTQGSGLYLTHNGSNTNIEIWRNYNQQLEVGHKYLFSVNVVNNDTATVGGLVLEDMMLIDLTQMFGSTIADYIYSLEQATAGAGVAWFRNYFTKDYYPYDPGTLRSVEGVSAHETVGFNQWDEEWEVGSISRATGQNENVTGQMRSKNYIRVLPNTQYYLLCADNTSGASIAWICYDENKNFISSQWIRASLFTTPLGCHYIRFTSNTAYGNTYKNDICINLSDPSRNGEYEPYVKRTYPLDSSLTLRGIPKLDANDNIYFDGDTYTADGTVGRRYAIVDLGTLTWTTTTVAEHTIFWANVPNGKMTNTNYNGICSKYPLYNDDTYSVDKSLRLYGNMSYQFSRAYIRDDSYIDAATFKTAMSGVYLIYELATPTTETAEPFTNPQVVDNWGTEAYITTGIVPVGHDTTYLTRDVFGGTLDLVSGRLVVTNKYDYNYDGGDINEPWISDRDQYVSGTKPTTGASICYPLTTPLTYQLTPKQIQTLVGTNNVWGNGSLNVRIAESARSIYALKEMPLTLTVDKGNITAVIERATSYHIDRPNETAFDGFEGETIAIKKGNVESFDIEDLIGSLDDGASYRLIVTVKDELGQSAEDSIDFEVRWTQQALIPEGQVVIDSEEYIAKITPQAPQGAVSTDRCDIYRLSSDRPELIVKDGIFGETYVDPYPAIGQFGGYRLVFRTANGDYITEDNEIAWLDIDESLDTGYTIIDFDGGQVFLEYNVDVSNAWAKDFQETKYLGGSVQGDWNPAVSRTSSINAVTITIVDEEQIEMIHRLAVTPSLCHVRTTGGASFSADVQVTENYTHEKRGKIASYTFAITRVDTEHLDGMTLAQWEDLQEDDELE